MKHLPKAFLLLPAMLCVALMSTGQVVVNEFCSANYTEWDTGGAGEYEDWIELYNPTGSPVNISGYWLSDDISDTQKWEFPTGTSVPANGFLIVLFSGTGDYDPGYLGYLNTNYKVTQTDGDDIVFSNTSGTVLESYDTELTGTFQANHSYGRITDGGDTWAIHTNPSPAATNSGPSATGYAGTPQLSVQAGYQAGPIDVTITADPGSTIYYTTDGSEPTNADELYTGPVSISTTTSLRAIAYPADAQLLPSFTETNTYFFGDDNHTIMVVSISGSTLSDGSWFGDELTHIEFFNPDGTFITEATGDSNEHGNDSNGYDQRGFDYVTRDELGYNNVIDHQVIANTPRPSFERIIFKAAANDNYPFSGGTHIRDAYVHHLTHLGGLNVDQRKTESCVMYINGEYWGVYEAREKVDDLDYCDYYYDQPEGFVDFIQTWGWTWVDYGTSDDWYDLVAFATSNDLTVQENYDYVLTQLDHTSLIDYFIVNGYINSGDWLNWNTAWWRGRHPDGGARKWRYCMWDHDASFGHYANFTGMPDLSATSSPCQVEDLGDVGGQGHVDLINELFENESFLADYVQRYASYSNTIFSCESMIAVLDSMAAVIAPEMQRQIDLWGGSYATWEANLQDLRDYINIRCQIIEGIEDCYDVTAFNVTVEIDGSGDIMFQSVSLGNGNTPFTGPFFGDLPIDLDALTEGGGCGAFAYWEITSGEGVIADPQSPQTTLTISSDVTIVAHFVEPSSGPVIITTDVFPAGAGTITVNGSLQGSYPAETEQDAGTEMSLSTIENEWFTFTHWETLHSFLSPDDETAEVTLVPCISDTIIAVFEAIEHYELIVNVGDNGGGFVVMNGDTLPAGENIFDLLTGNYSFTAIPEDEWSVFDHWEINGVTISPDEFDPSVILELIANGSITAVFTITPHFTVTVQVDPPYAGVVVFGENHITGESYSTDYILTVELEGQLPHNFDAAPQPYWNFTKWTSDIAQAFPDAELKDVTYTFDESDVVVAHFEQEEFNVFVPNSFSPNNDGRNDVFRMEGNAIDPSSYHMIIFNRWGEKVYESKDMNDVWEGDHHKGEYYVGGDIYHYMLTVKSVHDVEPKNFSGSITVVR